MRPRIFVTGEKAQGLRSLEELRRSLRSGHPKVLWDEIVAGAEADAGTEPIVPSTMTPGRDRVQAQEANRDWVVCNAAGQRVMRAALVALVTGESRYRYEALRQMAVLFDREQWPEWSDLAHTGTPADLRTGMLSQACALAYDWLHSLLSDSQRRFVVEGIDRCGIVPYFESIEMGAWWANCSNNWLPCIVGGLGIAGMALGEDHPRSEELVDFAQPRMLGYLSNYGPEGEFNESVGYAAATMLPATYFAAHRFWSGGKENVLGGPPFPEACRWYMHFILPPGRNVAFGDSNWDAPPMVAHFAAVADAARDPILQWFYLHHLIDSKRRNLCLELLWLDPSLAPAPPEGRMPHGRAFRAHGGCISSRTDWHPRSTACVVCGKTHGNEGHGHCDAGQVVIDGWGQRLVIDPGSPSNYPADFFGPNRNRYYNAGALGHNILVIGGREVVDDEAHRSKLQDYEFDDQKGGHWVIDLTGLYDGARMVRRSVAHLTPGIVVVLDEADLAQKEDISLRWHTVAPVAPDPIDRLMVCGNGVHLTARVMSLDGHAVGLTSGQHEYQPPFDRGRLGEPLTQRRESFVEARLTADRCRLLSLFAVFAPGEPPDMWVAAGDVIGIETTEGRVEVTLTPYTVCAAHLQSGRQWCIPRAEGR